MICTPSALPVISIISTKLGVVFRESVESGLHTMSDVLRRGLGVNGLFVSFL